MLQRMNRQVKRHTLETYFSLFEEVYLFKHPPIRSGHWPPGQLDV